jgi:hypothetical protein
MEGKAVCARAIQVIGAKVEGANPDVCCVVVGLDA